MFNNKGEPVGAQITNYLLEKGRVVGQIESERNFHIFYQFTKGASDDQRGMNLPIIFSPWVLIYLYLETFGLQGPDAYAYTSMSSCLSVQGIDDVKDFHETLVR